MQRVVATRSRWQLAAAGLAAASALLWLGWILYRSVSPAGELAIRPGGSVWVFLAQRSLELLTAVALPAAAAWWAGRRDVLRSRLGLAAVATWAGLLLAPPFATVLATPGSLLTPSVLAVARLTTVIFAVGALVAAVVAVRTRLADDSLNVSGARRVAAGGLATWAVASAVTSALLELAAPTALRPDGVTVSTVLPPAVPVVLILGVAAVVWRWDSVATASVAVAAVVYQALPAVSDAVLTLTRGEKRLWGRSLPDPATVAGAEVGVVNPLITLAAAAVLLGTTIRLVVAARRSWRFL